MLMLKILQGPSSVGTGYTLETGGSYVIGRAEGVDVRLKSSGVSKNHCRISVLPGNRIEVEDLGSANGTFVNGLLIKRHILKPGDTLAIHTFSIKLFMKAPTNVVNLASGTKNSGVGFEGNAAMDLGLQLEGQINAASSPSGGFSPRVEAQQNVGEKVGSWLSANVYPLADSMSAQFDLRFLIGIFFLIWSVMIIMFTAFPFKTAANARVETQALEVGKLYARQLVRVNSQATVEQRFRDLIGNLDAVQGQTKNIVASYIIDTQKQQILAPPADLGKPITNSYVQRAIQSFAETVNPYAEYAVLGDDGMGYAASPIMVGTPDGNKTVAMSFVMVNISSSKFSVAALFDQIVSSLLYSLLTSILFLIFVYRWMDGSLAMLSERVDYAMKRNEPTITSPVIWPAMKSLSEQISFALSKNSNRADEAPVGAAGNGDWANATVIANILPAASFDGSYLVQSWNEKMEMLTGQSSSMATGLELSQIWRETDVENAVKSLCEEASMSPWTTASREQSINGNEIRWSVIFGNGVYLLMAAPPGGDS